MCGLLVVYRPGGIDREEPRRLLEMLDHRGPDASGLWLSDDRRLALGHTRLKIIDLSEAANQPMLSSDGRWALIYNGEIVNFRDVRAAYRGPWQFRTSGDTEVLLASFAQRGAAAMDDWVGMFAFALLDREKERLYLVRDRFGIKPFYWTRLSDGGIAAASEIPPLLDLVSRVAADDSTIRTYLETGLYDTGVNTFFSGIRALEPGCIAELDLKTGELSERRWYRLGEHVPDLTGASEQELLERGSALVETAIRDHLIADVGVGLNVSGGVDSSVLVGLAAPTIKDLHVFTQDFEPPYSEAPWVRKVANGANLHLCKLGRRDIEASLDWTVRRQAEPFGGVTVAGYDSIYRAAGTAGVTVLLDGNGVDECFLGYTKYRNGEARPDAGLAIDGTEAVATGAIAPRLKRDASPIVLQNHGVEFGDPAKAMAAFDLLTAKIPRGLRFNDRMSMGRSKELRVPFLDHRLVEFGFGVPTRHLLAGGQTKSLFRKIARQWISDEIANAEKRSVQSPQREWLAQDWRSLVGDVLQSDSFAARGWIDPGSAQDIYRQYIGGNRDNSFFIWQWLNLEYWARAFLD
jgi:asparagine synthase (glutamine-hydrolysing)